MRGGSDTLVLASPPVSRFSPSPGRRAWVSSSAEVASFPCPYRLSGLLLSDRSVVLDPPPHTVSSPFAPSGWMSDETVLGGVFLPKAHLLAFTDPLYAVFELSAEVVAPVRFQGVVRCDTLHQLHHEAAENLTYSHWAYAWDLVLGHKASGHQGAVCRPG